MSNDANLYNENFNIIETNNSFNEIYSAYKENDNKNIVDELKGSIIISLTDDKNEIILCSDKLYNLSPRFDAPIQSTIDKNSNTTTIKLSYNDDHFSVTASKLELNSDIIKRITYLENKVKDLQEIIENLNNQDSNSRPVIPGDNLENENNN